MLELAGSPTSSDREYFSRIRSSDAGRLTLTYTYLSIAPLTKNPPKRE